MVLITIVTGAYNQLITGGPHIVPTRAMRAKKNGHVDAETDQFSEAH